MQSSTRFIVLLSGFLLTGSLAVAQQAADAPAYTQQAQRYEKLGNYRKAIEAYRQAQASAVPADRKSIGQTIDRLEDLMQQQTLVNQARADKIQPLISTLSSPQNRKRLQDDLTALQQRDNATPADFQSLAIRVEALKEVETALADNTGTSPPIPVRSDAHTLHRPTAPRPPGPPPKTITITLPRPVRADAAANTSGPKTAGATPGVKKIK